MHLNKNIPEGIYLERRLDTSELKFLTILSPHASSSSPHENTSLRSHNKVSAAFYKHKFIVPYSSFPIVRLEKTLFYLVTFSNNQSPNSLKQKEKVEYTFFNLLQADSDTDSKRSASLIEAVCCNK